MGIRLTERDHRLVAKLAVARWLTTSQVQRLFFARATLDAVRKRLRKLAGAGIVRSCQVHQMAEALHAVGRKGKLVLEDKGPAVELEKGPPKQMEHFIGINDVRVAVECGGTRIFYFFAAWELGQIGWAYRVIPDAIFAVGGGKPSTVLLEYDCGTETMGQFSNKLRAYRSELGSLQFGILLVVANTPVRLNSLCRCLRRHPLHGRRYLAALLRDIQEGGIFGKVFVDVSHCNQEAKKVSLTEIETKYEPVKPLLSDSLSDKRGLSG